MSTTTATITVNLLAQELKVAEQLARAKYPHLNIVEGSMTHDTTGTYAGKRVCTVICPCGCNVRRATSDLFTFKGCPTCKKAVVKANKGQNQLNKLLAAAKMLEELNKAKIAAESAKVDEQVDEDEIAANIENILNGTPEVPTITDIVNDPALTVTVEAPTQEPTPEPAKEPEAKEPKNKKNRKVTA